MKEVIRLSGVEHESIVDGPGIRLVYFMQGCKHDCKGCHNPQTHSFTGGKEVSISEMYQIYKNEILCSGVTLSGGDPMEQADALLTFVKLLKSEGVNIICYTGYTWEYLQQYGTAGQKALLEYIDVLIDGPFILEKRTLNLKYRGSSNQRLIDVQTSLKTKTVQTIEL